MTGLGVLSGVDQAALDLDAMALSPPGVAHSVHTYSNLWLFPWSYDTIFAPDDAQLRDYAREMTASNGYAYGTSWEVLYVANGVADDYYYGQHGAMAFTPEIGSSSDGFWPSPSRIPALFEDVRPAYLMTCKWAGSWADIGGLVWTEQIGNGDEFVEAGETWDISFQIENRGMDNLDLKITPSSSTSFINLSGGTKTVQVPKWSTATSPSWSVVIQSSAPTGSTAKIDLGFEWDGIPSSTEVSFLIGRPRLLVHDDMESFDFGWQVSNSTNYSWERAVPQKTTSSGQTAQPGNDNPSGSGTMCWVTGAAAGSSAGTNDVDGTTWLTSPLFSLAGFSNADLEYSRWFANLPGSGLDDRLLAQISNDSGSTWVTLEEPSNDNQWAQKNFSLSNYLSLTDSMQVRFRAEDNPNNDLTEACIDDVKLQVWSDLPSIGFWGKAELNQNCSFFIDGQANSRWDFAWSFSSRPTGKSVPGTAGLLYLQSPEIFTSGTTGSDGQARLDLIVPNSPILIGRTVYFQIASDYGGPGAAFSNLLAVAFN